MSDLPSVAPRDSASQAGAQDVDIVQLTAAIMKPFELYVSGTQLPPLTFLGLYREMVIGICKVLDAAGFESSQSAPAFTSFGALNLGVGPAPGAQVEPVDAGVGRGVGPGSQSSVASSNSSRSSAARRRARRLKAKAARDSAAVREQLRVDTVCPFTGTVDGTLVAPFAGSSGGLGSGYCYLHFAARGRSSRLASLLGPTPTVVKLLAAPASLFDMAAFSDSSIVRSIDGDWHVEASTCVRPTSLSLLRRFVSERMATHDLTNSMWEGTLVRVVAKAPLVLGAIDLPAVGDRVGAGPPAYFPAVSSSLVPSDVPQILRSMYGAEFAAPAGFGYQLYKFFVALLSSLRPVAVELGFADAVTAVFDISASVDQMAAAMGGDAVFGLVVDPATVLVCGTKMVSNLYFYYRAASAVATEICEERAGCLSDAALSVGRDVARLSNQAVLGAYALLMVIVDQLDVNESTRDRSRALVTPVVQYYGLLLSAARQNLRYADFLSIPVVTQDMHFDDLLPSGLALAVNTGFYGKYVEMVSEWHPALVSCGLFLTSTAAHAAAMSEVTGVSVGMLSVVANSSAPSLVYFADPSGAESESQLLVVLSACARRLVVVGSLPSTRLSRWLAQVRVTNRYAPVGTG